MSTRCQIEFYDAPETKDVFETELGEPAARIYQHGDGYPQGTCGILARLKKLEHRVSGKDVGLKKFPHSYDPEKTAFDLAKIYGPRLNDPEWCAAEYITLFRTPMGGSIYVTQAMHPDIAYLYRVICTVGGFVIRVFQPEHDETYDITSYREMTAEELADLVKAERKFQRGRAKRIKAAGDTV